MMTKVDPTQIESDSHLTFRFYVCHELFRVFGSVLPFYWLQSKLKFQPHNFSTVNFQIAKLESQANKTTNISKIKHLLEITSVKDFDQFFHYPSTPNC